MLFQKTLKKNYHNVNYLWCYHLDPLLPNDSISDSNQSLNFHCHNLDLIISLLCVVPPYQRKGKYLPYSLYYWAPPMQNSLFTIIDQINTNTVSEDITIFPFSGLNAGVISSQKRCWYHTYTFVQWRVRCLSFVPP